MYINNKKYPTNKLGVLIYDFNKNKETEEFYNISNIVNDNIIYKKFNTFSSYGRHINKNRFGIHFWLK
jgi:hypothetical protein